MMKILWSTNITLPAASKKIGLPILNKEGWLSSLASSLIKLENIELYILSFENTLFEPVFFKQEGINYIIMPKSYAKRSNRDKFLSFVDKIKKDISPQIFHINGTEYGYALRILKELNIPSIISIQGLVTICARYSLIGFDIRYLLKHPLFLLWSIRNIKSFENRGKNEIEYFKSVKYAIGRTDWDYIHSKMINPQILYYKCNETLREPFYIGKWNLDNVVRHQIYVSQANYSIKGFHILIEALGILKKQYSDLKIIVAGANPYTKRKTVVHEMLSMFDYGNYIKNRIKELDLSDNITFTGTLNEYEVKEFMLHSHLTIVPSTLENSPNSLGEAQLLGVPCIASYVGGIPSIADYGNTALLYRCEEWEMLVELINRIFSDDLFALELSKREIASAQIRHNPIINTQQMFDIYSDIIKKNY